jgi:hypothetical protein
LYSHGFEENDKWLIKNCPTTIGKDCPVCANNREMWSVDQDLVRRRKRKLNYYANIMVVKDPQNRENEGKVFIFKYGKKIQEKIMEKLKPAKDSIDEPVMVFDYYDGANFKLKVKLQKTSSGTFPNYDSSSFAEPSELFSTDEEIEKIHNSLHGLADVVSDDKFESYEEIKNRFDFVTGISKNEEAIALEIESVFRTFF